MIRAFTGFHPSSRQERLSLAYPRDRFLDYRTGQGLVAQALFGVFGDGGHFLLLIEQIIADAEHVLISEKYITGFARYVYEVLRVGLPTDRDITIGAKPNVDEQMLYALDWRSGTDKEYYPTQEPYNAQLQQEFTRVLKDVIGHAREVVTMLS